MLSRLQQLARFLGIGKSAAAATVGPDPHHAPSDSWRLPTPPPSRSEAPGEPASQDSSAPRKQ